MRSARGWGGGLAIGLLLSAALALPPPGRSQDAARGTIDLVPPRDESTVAMLRSTLREATRAILADDVGRRLRVETHWPPRSPRAAALAGELEEAVAEALREGGQPSGEAALHLELVADDRELRVALVPEEGERSWWRRLFVEPAGARRWRVALNPELRAFVDARPRASRSHLSVDRVRLPGRSYLAVGTARFGPTEQPLVVLVTDDAVELYRFHQGRRRPVLRLVGRAERPPGPTPGVLARRPFATLLVEGDEVSVRWRDRQGGYRIAWGALRLEPVPGACPGSAHPWPDACAEPVDGRDYFASALLPRTGRDAPRRAPSSFYARWHDWVRRSDGSVAEVEVVVNPRGRLVARTDRREIGLVGHGAALGVGDMDSDGQVEILTSSSEEAVAEDELRLLRLQADGGLRRLWSLAVPGAVRVAGAGDLDGDGVPALLAIVEGPQRAELMVLR